MIKAVIIEDNTESAEVLTALIKDFLPQVNLLGTAKSITKAKTLIDNAKPQIVFLDIDLEEGTGFDLLKLFDRIDFEVIFITGHAGYAIEAFKYNALHYIEKPPSPQDLIEAVNRAQKANKTKGINKGEFDTLLQSVRSFNKKKIAVPVSDGVQFILTEDIVYIKGEGSYSRVKLANGCDLLVSRLIKDFEQQIEERKFFRISKSYLVNLEQVAMFKRTGGGIVVMTDGTEVSVPRKKKDDFTLALSEFLS